MTNFTFIFFLACQIRSFFCVEMLQSKKKSTTKSRCAVKTCKATNVSIHLMPKNNLELRQKWIEKLQLPSDCGDPVYVCGDHFADKHKRKGPSRTYLHHNAEPSINLPSIDKEEYKPAELSIYFDDGEEEPISDEEIKCFEANEATAVNVDVASPDKPDELAISFDDGEEEPISDEGKKSFEVKEATAVNVDVASPDKPDELTIYFDDGEEETSSDEENRCFEANEAIAVKHYDKCLQTNLAYDELIKPWTLLDVLHTDSDLQSWTGLPSFVTLNNIMKCLAALQSAQDQLQRFKATPKLLVVFVMARLKTNLTFKQLACLFSLTPRTLADYFDKFIPILKAVLKPVIFWPTEEQVSNNLPKCFQPNFKDCFVVMDCTETPIERLKSLESRIKTHSHYKGYYTGKINITSVPSGLVVNVSKAYGGKASDKYIVIKEKIIEKMSAGKGIMVDKGYNIEKETSEKDIKLYRPPILDKPQLSKAEAIFNTSVASSRIHVERIIQRIKMFNIFNAKMNKSMLKHIDDIVFIACAITNLSAPILSEDKF